MTLVDPSHRILLTGKRILVVEDEALVALLIEDILGDAGATVLGPASSVAEALDLVRTAMAGGGISAAVLDLSLAGEAVLPVADVLAECGVPFLFATGYGVNRDTGLHDGPILQKPFDPDWLVATVESLITSK